MKDLGYKEENENYPEPTSTMEKDDPKMCYPSLRLMGPAIKKFMGEYTLAPGDVVEVKVHLEPSSFNTQYGEEFCFNVLKASDMSLISSESSRPPQKPTDVIP